MDSEESLFVTRTPLHILAAYALSERSDHDCHLFVAPLFDRKKANFLVDFLNSNDTFETVQYLERQLNPTNEHTTGWTRKKIIHENIRTVRSFLREVDVAAVYTSLDNEEVEQAAMHFASRYGTEAKCIHIEDGSVAYCSDETGWKTPRIGWLKRAVYRVLYGFEYENVRIYGNSRWVDELRLTHPALVRSELQGIPSEAIPASPFQDLSRSGFDSYLDNLGASDTAIETVETVFLVPPGEKVRENDQMTETVTELLDTLANQDVRVGVKYHPRDDKTDAPGYHERPGFQKLSSEMPIELLFTLSDIELNRVIGMISTALKSAMWLRDDVRAVSYANMAPSLYPYEQELLEQFKRMGVDVISETAEL